MTPLPVTAIPVTSGDDPRVDDYRALNDQNFRRAFEGDALFIAEGFVAIERLIDSDHQIRSVLLAPSRVARFRTRLDELAARNVPVYVAERDVITDVVGFDLHRGVVAAASRLPHRSLGDVVATCSRLAVLEGLNDAENLGAIARAARALGIDALVIDPTCTDPYSRRSIRVSMGEILRMPVVRVDAAGWPDVFSTLREAGFDTWAMTPSTEAADIWELEPPRRLAVVFGAEGPGLAKGSLVAASHRVRIPVRAGVDSLNVGHAAAITFAAIARPHRA
jgi:tRNA G18 (ribose-2'-O)-methylase SpoU